MINLVQKYSNLLFMVGVVILPLPAVSLTPQTTIQETYIEGTNNVVNQQLNQNLVLGLIYLPDWQPIKNEFVPQIQIQDTYLNGNFNNVVNQELNQSLPEFLVSNNHQNNSAGSLLDGDFFNNNLILEPLQYSKQEVYVYGNNNQFEQQSDQSIIDFEFWDSDLINNQQNPHNLISSAIDFTRQTSENREIQVAGQNLEIFGNNNQIEQSSNQTIHTFLLIDEPIDAVNRVSLDNFNGSIQFSIQETFIVEGKNNQVSQSIDQQITDVFFVDGTTIIDDNNITNNNNPTPIDDFDIDAFIRAIFDSTIEAKNSQDQQINAQYKVIEGNFNQESQKNEQTITTVPEPDSINSILIFGFLGVIIRYFWRC